MQYLYGNTQRGTTPGPEVDITLSSPRDPSKATHVVAILDTGADMSAFPERALLALGQLARSSRKIRDTSTTVRRATIFANVIFGEWPLTDQEFAVLPVPYAIIGRDILNAYSLTFHGPLQAWQPA